MTTTAVPQPVAAAASRPALVRRPFAAAAGIVAAGAALATGELVAAFVSGAPSPVAAVGAAVIDFAPPGAKEVAVALFGTNDKAAILALVTLTVLLIGAALGLVARTRPTVAVVGIGALVGVGFLAAVRLPEAQLPMALLSAALQAGVGIQVLTLLMAAAPRDGVHDPRTGLPVDGRRGFLVRAGALGALAVVGGGIG